MEYNRIDMEKVSLLWFKKEDMMFFCATDAEVIKHIGIVMEELYEKQSYAFYPVKGCWVIDIGAFYGDTAIWFLRQGAAHVIACEPYLSSTFIPLNIAINRSKYNPKDAEIISKPVLGEKKGVHYDRYSINDGSRTFSEDPFQKLEESITLNEILSGIPNDAEIILKLDCEGSEIEILQKTHVSELMRCRALMMEVHNTDKNLQFIITLLENSGFKVDKVERAFPTTSMLYASRK